MGTISNCVCGLRSDSVAVFDNIIILKHRAKTVEDEKAVLVKREEFFLIGLPYHRQSSNGREIRTKVEDILGMSCRRGRNEHCVNTKRLER